MKKQNTRRAFPAAVLFAFLSVVLASCDLFAPDSPGDHNRPMAYNEFFAQNFVTGAYYVLAADMLAEGRYVRVWAERGSGVSREQAQAIADEYDYRIRPGIVNVFARKDFMFSHAGSEIHFDDVLHFANWLTGGDDGKLTILLLDIRDGWRDPQTDAYVAGYFFSGDFFPQGRIPGTNHFSNGRDMIYIDTFPGLLPQNWDQALLTIAHELQHLVNFATTVQMGRIRMMDLWIDEGLASQAEHVYLEGNVRRHVEWFARDIVGTIAAGNNFFVWGNHVNREPLAILDDYATVYLFFRWLFLQAQANTEPEFHERLFYKMVTSPHYDYRIVTELAKEINPDWASWDVLLKTWLAANFYPESPVFGYLNDDELRGGLRVRPIVGQEAVPLYPGEGVFSRIVGPFVPPASGRNVRYAGVAPGGIFPFDDGPIAGDFLLTFNVDTNASARAETGFLTGAPPANLGRGAEEPLPAFAGPFVIDARDVRGRNTETEIRDFFFPRRNTENRGR